MTLDLAVYGLADPAVCPRERLPAMVGEAIAGGATLIQLRDKRGETRSLLALAEALLAVTRPLGVPLLVNDRVDVALAAGADGVHLGQDDMPVEHARHLLGPRSIIGLTVRSLDEAQGMPVDLVDYAAIGGVFATTSKDNDAAPIGLNGLARIAQSLRLRAPGMPLCAIAGITAQNAGEVIAAGVDGVAAISSLFGSAHAESAARELKAAVDGALRERAAA